MAGRRSFSYAVLTVSLAALAFSLGTWVTHRALAERLADSDARMAALFDHMARGILQIRQTQAPESPAGQKSARAVATAGAAQDELVDEVKRQIQSEMGLFPVRLLRERQESFVELNTIDSAGKESYGTAGYLGQGYFITVKHAVAALGLAGRSGRRMETITIRYKGAELAASVVDAGNADTEVHPGDWAIIRVREPVHLKPLRVDTAYGFEFADPIVRLGNDYSKGIIVSTGYVGQRTGQGLVTCLTDGHPGVSGGGVLNQRGDLVGIPVGRMQGDYRFSFILPIRAEMFRKVAGVLSPPPDRQTTE
jgi:Trypsin-like peptidase domain